MKLNFAVLADHVSNAGGKLFISGTFDVFSVTALPAALPAVGLAIKVEGSHGEVGKHNLSVTLRDEDGGSIVPSMEMEFPIAAGAFVKGAPPSFQAAMNISGLNFVKAGTYDFEIMVDGRHMGSIPFHVVQRSNTAQAA
jgi:uncharacterized protein DUF6941